MSQQLAGRGGRGKGGRHRVAFASIPKPFKSPITEIAYATFNTGQTKYAAQFTLSRKNIANYVQRTGGKESFMVARTIQTGDKQVIALPAAIWSKP